MQGFNVLYPIGWDAFGLPTENYAIKTGRKPADITRENTDTFRRQIQNLGISFDWSREINTTDPAYYKWTQWLFLKFYEHDLAYKAKMLVNWCPKDKIGLANEEVIDGKCERCGTPVEKREKEQWMLAITKYADRLDKDLDTVDYPERVKAQQRHWIGRSEGAEINFDTTLNEQIKIFTTRPDTIFGATYLVLAPEHAFVKDHADTISNLSEVKAYIAEVKDKEEIERTAEGKEKTGVELQGVKAINPATKEEIPVWIADYVLPHYGTGAIMAVPSHDERDFEFAEKFGLPIQEVIEPVTGEVLANEEFRKSIVAIVEDPKTGKVLTLDWTEKFGGILFIGGGREEGEEPEETAIREIKEETGYKNLRVLGVAGKSHHHYFAFSKNVARNIEVIGVHLELVDDEREEPKLEENEKNRFTVKWLSKDEAEKSIHDENHALIFRKFIRHKPYSGAGILTNSDMFNGRSSEAAKEDIIKFVGGEKKVTFKLRDWVFSRQRYWGEPIPMIHCKECGWQPVPEKDLPVLLPEVEKYEPTDNGESPLASIDTWVNTTCSKCGGQAKRETDTMPNWAGSSWYFLRYTDPRNDKNFASEEALKHWMSVDWYNGGMEHTTLHLLYSRFWNKFFFDIGLVPTSEPYKKRTSHGLILAEGGEKMSKSKGNVVNPDAIVEMFGADSLRIYEMFMGPFEQAISWNESSLVGMRRFLERVWKLNKKISESAVASQDDERMMHEAIKKVSEDIENLGFNTAVSALMAWVNMLDRREVVTKEEYKTLILLLAPFAPHISEEIWSSVLENGSIHEAAWPSFDEKKLKKQLYNMAVQVNGKLRGTFEISSSAEEEEVKSAALALPEVEKWLNGAAPKKVIVVLGRVVNIVL